MLKIDHPPFRAARLLGRPHLQTLAGFLAPGRMPAYRAVPHVVPLTDGDRLVVHDDRPQSWAAGDRVAILVHGLCGSHASSYVRRSADRLNQSGIRTVRIDLRGCGCSALVSRGHTHAGLSGDLQDVVEFVSTLCPASKISLVGFSLGGNTLLKLVGEWGASHPSQVDSAVAVAPPVDLQWSSVNLRRYGNRIYEYYYMRQLSQQLAMRRRRVANLVDNGCLPLPRRLLHFDDQFVAPVSGFRGAREYYQQSSAAPLLNQIAIPTVLLSARDDPVVPFAMFQQAQLSDQVELVTTDQGGHLGYVGRHPHDPDRHWMEWRICQWITSVDAGQSAG